MGESLLKRIIETMKHSRFSKTKTGAFILGVLVELDSVTWPSKDEIYSSTVITLITVAFFAVYAGLWDLVMKFVQNTFIFPLYG